MCMTGRASQVAVVRVYDGKGSTSGGLFVCMTGRAAQGAGCSCV